MPKRLSVEQHKNLIARHYPVVVGGYSGRGYEDPNRVRQKVRHLLESLVSEHGRNLLVLSGATAAGIGLVYEVARDLGISTSGVVSELASAGEISSFCDSVLFLPDPTGTWEVMSEDGDSYLVEAARKGQMLYFGGGQVASREIAEAKAKSIPVLVFPFAPAD